MAPLPLMPPCGTLPQPARRRFPPVPSWPSPASPPRPATLGVAAATGEAAGRWPQPPRGEAGGSRGGREGGREERRKGWGRGAERAHALLMAGAEGAAGGARQVTGREGMGGGRTAVPVAAWCGSVPGAAPVPGTPRVSVPCGASASVRVLSGVSVSVRATNVPASPQVSVPCGAKGGDPVPVALRCRSPVESLHLCHLRCHTAVSPHTCTYRYPSP